MKYTIIKSYYLEINLCFNYPTFSSFEIIIYFTKCKLKITRKINFTINYFTNLIVNFAYRQNIFSSQVIFKNTIAVQYC